MKVLVLTNMYPKADAPYYGVFVKEQVEQTQALLGEEQLDCHFIDGKGALQKYLLSTLAIYRKVKTFKPNIIHLHFGLTILPLLILYPWLKFKGIKLVLTTHGGDVVGHYPITRLVTKLAIRLSNYVINVSHQTNEIVKKVTKHASYIPCGVTKDFYSSSKKRARSVVFPSSPSRPEKNYTRFCSIINEVKNRIKEPFNVALLEDLSRQQVAELFRASTVMLMTSDYEGSPQAVKEAIMCDLPVVSTNAGDVAMLLNNYEHCVVSENDEELINAVCYWLNTHTEFQYAEQDKLALDNVNVCRQVINIYQGLLN